MFEQFRYQGFGKFIFIQDNEGIAVVGPSNEFGIPAIFEKAGDSQRRDPTLTRFQSVSYLFSF